MSDLFVETPEPPYWAVIFTFNLREELSDEEITKYRALAASLMDIAREMPGFYGEDGARGDDLSITVSYWRDEESIIEWRDNAKHIAARKHGKDNWYKKLKLRVAKVERAMDFDLGF